MHYILISRLRKGSCRDSYSPKGALHGTTDPQTPISESYYSVVTINANKN